MECSIQPENAQLLRRAVKIARDINPARLPNILFIGKIKIINGDAAGEFGPYFDKMVKGVLEEVSVVDDFYNGRRLIVSENKMFLDISSVRECLLSLKHKNSEGLYRTPQRMLLDSSDYLLAPLKKLFELICKLRLVPVI
jgi:hypothetical protein